jgi:hypothetical protein
MKVFAAIPLLATLLATAAADSVRGARELKEPSVPGDPATTAPLESDLQLFASSAKSWKFPQVKLTQVNVKAPFIGVSYGAGIAAVQLYYNPDAVTGKTWKACIKTNVIGFIPGQLKIYKAKITENGAAPYVDYNSMLDTDSPRFSGCRYVNKTTFEDMRDNSVRRRRPLSAIVSPLRSSLLFRRHVMTLRRSCFMCKPTSQLPPQLFQIVEFAVNSSSVCLLMSTLRRMCPHSR